MQIGISTASLFPRYATEDALKKIMQSGAECAEVFFSTFYEYRPEFSKSFARDVKSFPVNSVHAGCAATAFIGSTSFAAAHSF